MTYFFGKLDIGISVRPYDFEYALKGTTSVQMFWSTMYTFLLRHTSIAPVAANQLKTEYRTTIIQNQINLHQRRRKERKKRPNQNLPQHFEETFQFHRPAEKSSAFFKNRRF